MKEYIKPDDTNTTSRTIAIEELGKTGDTKTNNQPLSVGVRLKTGIKSGPTIRGRRRRVYHKSDI